MKRTLLILASILFVLIVVTLLLLQRPGEQSTTGTEGEVLFSIDSTRVDKIEITSPGTSVVLEKKGVEWFLQSPLQYRAEQSTVASMIGQVKNLRIKATVSSNPEKQSLFQVDSTGTLVKVYEAGKEKASFIVGKMGPSFAETYVRRTDANDVYLIDGSLSVTFSRPVKDWRDRAIVTLARENITSIVYQFGDTSFTLSRIDTVWMLDKQMAKETEVNSVLSSLSELRADDFIDTTPTPAPKFTITISCGGVVLRFAEIKGESKYIVQSSASPQLFEVAQWRANQVLKRKKDFLQQSS
jgi:hypothetical protein